VYFVVFTAATICGEWKSLSLIMHCSIVVIIIIIVPDNWNDNDEMRTGFAVQLNSAENYGRRCVTPLNPHRYDLAIINEHYYTQWTIKTWQFIFDYNFG